MYIYIYIYIHTCIHIHYKYVLFYMFFVLCVSIDFAAKYSRSHLARPQGKGPKGAAPLLGDARDPLMPGESVDVFRLISCLYVHMQIHACVYICMYIYI